MPPEQPRYLPPQETQPQAQVYSIDYLNEISQPIKTSNGPSIKLLVAVILIGIASVVLFAVMMLTARPSVNSDMVALNQRLTTLQTIAKKEHRYLRSSDLRSTNSSYQLFLANSLTSMEAPLETLGVDAKKVDKALVAKEADHSSGLTNKLEDSRLNAVLDRTYARDMAYELDVVRSMMKSIYGKTSSKSTKSFLEKSDANLAPIAKRFAEFSASDS